MTTPQTTDPAELLDIDEVRAAAEPMMPEAYRDFVNNRGMEKTLQDDIRAWSAIHLRPRALIDVREVDTSVTVLGTPISMPIITAPFVGSTFVHPDGEVATARGAMGADTITTLSMNGSRTPEQVGAVAPGHYWQQLYMVRDRGVVRDVVARAVAAGASALGVTVDLPVMPSFPRPMRDAMGALFEQWARDEHMMYAVRNYRDRPFGATFPDAGVTWADLEWVRGLSELPLILKGVSSGPTTRSSRATTEPPRSSSPITPVRDCAPRSPWPMRFRPSSRRSGPISRSTPTAASDREPT
ncbi:MAG: alpha-hydroxy-acid oxidizing protein, partial [Microbacterium sp.]|nr:alpha-hydroxy-acid oxidizing protein [Microbacterium sp.]